MESYNCTMSTTMDTHRDFYPSAFESGDFFHPDESNLDFLFAPHELWPQSGNIFQGHPCMNDMDLGHLPYDAPISCHQDFYAAPAADAKRIESNIDNFEPQENASHKRKRAGSTKTSSRKQARTTTKRSASPRSTTADAASTPSTSSRAHYAVEKRYRSTLNERYATLARLLSQPETQDICRTQCSDWEVPAKLEAGSNPNGERDSSKRQSKTTTLSVAIDTIALLDRACRQKAKEYQSMVCRLNRLLQSTDIDLGSCNKA